MNLWRKKERKVSWSNFLVFCCERFYGLLVFIRGNWRTFFFEDLKLLCNGEYVREIFRHDWRTWILRRIHFFILCWSCKRDNLWHFVCILSFDTINAFALSKKFVNVRTIIFYEKKKYLCIMLYTLSVRTCRFCCVLFFFCCHFRTYFCLKDSNFSDVFTLFRGVLIS